MVGMAVFNEAPIMKLRLIAPLAGIACLGALAVKAEVFIVGQEQREWMCQRRATCDIASVSEAGSSLGGHRLGVAEVHLGIQDRPEFAPDEGCISAGFQSRDGGVEYWLVDGPQPRRVLQLCNNGYGAAGVGDDQVVIGENMISHTQSGGSAWRWTQMTTMSLVPFLTIRTRNCYYHNMSPGNGSVIDVDRVTWQVRSLGLRTDPNTGEADLGCPEWTEQVEDGFSPEPAVGVVGGFSLLHRVTNYGSDGPGLARGQILGNCSVQLSSDGAAGFLTYGQPARPAEVARIAVLADTAQTLVIQVFDSTAAEELANASAANWVHRPHVEVWIAPEWDGVGGNPPPEDLLQQIGIELDGQAHAGYGNVENLPSVERWERRDAGGRPEIILRLTWPESTAMGSRIGIAYSQSEEGKQARVVANTGIVHNRPLFLPELVATRALTDEETGSACVIRDGVLVRGDQP